MIAASRKSWGSIICLAIGLGLVTPRLVFGTHPLITDDSETQGTGHAQFEIYGNADHHETGRTQTDSLALTTALTYGVSPDVDAVVSLPVRCQRSGKDGDYGISDMSIELKWRYYRFGRIDLFMLGGLVYSVTKGADLDLGILHGPTIGPDYSVLFGLTLRI